jgi:hypothetical protein
MHSFLNLAVFVYYFFCITNTLDVKNLWSKNSTGFAKQGLAQQINPIYAPLTGSGAGRITSNNTVIVNGVFFYNF